MRERYELVDDHGQLSIWDNSARNYVKGWIQRPSRQRALCEQRVDDLNTADADARRRRLDENP